MMDTATQNKIVQIVTKTLGPTIMAEFNKRLQFEVDRIRAEIDQLALLRQRLEAVEALQDKAVRKVLADLPPIVKGRRAQYVEPEPKPAPATSTVTQPGWDMKGFAKGLAQLAKQFGPDDTEKAFSDAINAIKEKSENE